MYRLLYATLKDDITPKKQISENRTLISLIKKRDDFGDTQSDLNVLKIFPTDI